MSIFVEVMMRRRAKIISLFLVFFALFPIVSYCVFIEFSRYSMRAMNCEVLSVHEFNLRLNEALIQPKYLADKKYGVSQVRFHFNLEPELIDGAVLVVESDRAGRAIYSGDYKKSIVVQAGYELLNENGSDNFKFIIFNKKNHEICSFEHGSTPFWQAGKDVYIDFLPFRELDPATGEAVAFKVRVE